MADPLIIDTPELRKSSQWMVESGQDLTNAHHTLVQTLQSIGNVWGNDEVGKNFIGDYTKQATPLLEWARDASAYVKQTGESIGHTADLHDKAEDVTTFDVSGFTV